MTINILLSHYKTTWTMTFFPKLPIDATTQLYVIIHRKSAKCILKIRLFRGSQHSLAPSRSKDRSSGSQVNVFRGQRHDEDAFFDAVAADEENDGGGGLQFMGEHEKPSRSGSQFGLDGAAAAGRLGSLQHCSTAPDELTGGGSRRHHQQDFDPWVGPDQNMLNNLENMQVTHALDTNY